MRVVLLLALLTLLAVPTLQDRPKLQLLLSSSLSAPIAQRLTELVLLSSNATYDVILQPRPLASLPAGSYVLSFGDTSVTRSMITEKDLSGLGAEGFIIRSGTIQVSGGWITVFAADGVAPNPKITDFFPPERPIPNTGRNYACYALLEKLGFAFLHPLQPHIPSPPSYNIDLFFEVQKSPKWPLRGWHYHTEHPLDLTNFLNGWGLNSTNDAAGWASMMPDWHKFLEWLVANRQNAIEFLLLAADEWQSFVASATRQQRLRNITDAGYAWGVAIAADIPIAERQQHAWYMTDGLGTLQDQINQIQTRIDWLVAAGFHFLSTESGFSEFTHPDCSVMVAWMNATTDYNRNRYNRRTFIKAHISHGQECPGYADPTTGKPPCNFNYLPHYATSDLGVLAHTVQLYTFDDPAPTYGQTNFQNMYDFTLVEAPLRYTLYHGETAYWVNYDVDVPLFLPLYASARLYDLRKLARAESRKGIRIMGQFNFESGWEWSYWLSNTLTARAAWDPKSSDLTERDALSLALTDITRIFGQAATPINDWLMSYIDLQHDILVLGKINGSIPDSVVRRNGISYLEGWDTWAQLMPIVGIGTQPLNLDISSMSTASGQMFYGQYTRPLLETMATKFRASFNAFTSITAPFPASAASYYNDLRDSALITVLRAEFVFAAYDSIWTQGTVQWRKARLSDAIQKLQQALVVVQTRESQYRVPLERIAAWGRNINPTSYDYGFLWTVHSLFYWYRDLYRVMDKMTAWDPCFLNIIDPARVAFGDGGVAEFEQWLATYLQSIGLGTISQCLEAPKSEPKYQLPPI